MDQPANPPDRAQLCAGCGDELAPDTGQAFCSIWCKLEHAGPDLPWHAECVDCGWAGGFEARPLYLLTYGCPECGSRRLGLLRETP